MTSYRTATWVTDRGSGHRVTRATVAAERGAGYDPRPPVHGGPSSPASSGRQAGKGGDGHQPPASEVPFGLPVLVEVPALAGVLEAIELAERQMLQAVVGVAGLVAGDEVAQTTGVSVEHWLAIVCRQTRLDRRLLLRLARLLDRFPTLAAGVAAGRVSFAQLRGLGIVLRQAPKVIDAELEVLLGRLLAELQGADPDVLVDQVRQAIVELAPTATVEASDQPTNRLVIQPNLAGTGGRFAGELDTLGLAILDQTTAPRRDQRNTPAGWPAPAPTTCSPASPTTTPTDRRWRRHPHRRRRRHPHRRRRRHRHRRHRHRRRGRRGRHGRGA
jgi:hypothetical protein